MVTGPRPSAHFVEHRRADAAVPPAGRDFFFDHFTAPDAHFFWCQRRARQFELDLSKLRHCSAHFERMLQRPSVQKLLAFEKSVQDDFAKAA